MLKREDFLHGRKSIGVWGAGFIGATTAMAFASEGVNAICYDIDERTVRGINMGKVEVTNLEFWFGTSMEEFVNKGLVKATSDVQDMYEPNIAVHFIAVPTEKGGEPWNEPLKIVLKHMQRIKPELVIIESTLTPNTLDELDIEGLRIGISPRRDWFHSPEKNLKNLKRVFGAKSPEIAADMRTALSIVCDNLLQASNERVASLVKSVENSLLHVPSVLAVQLAKAYPDLDVNEVLQLASTHWRIGLYYPSLGTGGYCIPVSSKYVMYGATKPEELSILRTVLDSDAVEPYFIAEKLSKRVKGKIGVMGISYKGDLKVHTLSPTLRIVERLKQNPDIQVLVNDPYYTADEIKSLLGVEQFDFTKSLNTFEAIVLVSDHKVYGRYPLTSLLKEIKKGCIIIDNYGIWKKHSKALHEVGIKYYRVGDPGWTLEKVE